MAKKRPPADLVLHGSASDSAPEPKPGSRRDRRRRSQEGTNSGRPVITITVTGGRERPPGPMSCATCQGPLLLCQGRHDPAEGLGGPEERRVVMGLRAAYLGALLTGVAPAERFGGVLLLASRTILRSANLREARMAPFIADPELPQTGPLEIAAMACKLVEGEPMNEGLAFQFKNLLVHTKSSYLFGACSEVVGAAKSCHVTARSERDLVALLCPWCAEATASCDDHAWDHLVAATEYDHAIVCPRCHVEHDHPFGKRLHRKIHAVSRCFGDDNTGCRLHGGLPLTLGLCDKGRAIYEGAFESMAGAGNRPREPWEDRLIGALARAKRREDLEAHEAMIKHEVEPFMDSLGRALNGLVGRVLAPPKGVDVKALPLKGRRVRSPDEP